MSCQNALNSWKKVRERAAGSLREVPWLIEPLGATSPAAAPELSPAAFARRSFNSCLYARNRSLLLWWRVPMSGMIGGLPAEDHGCGSTTSALNQSAQEQNRPLAPDIAGCVVVMGENKNIHAATRQATICPYLFAARTLVATFYPAPESGDLAHAAKSKWPAG